MLISAAASSSSSRGSSPRRTGTSRRVTELDPNDAAAWYWMASTLTDPDDPTQPAGPRQAKEQIALFTKALELDPYLTPAIYKLSFAYRLAGQPEKQKELLERWREINPDRQKPVPGPGNSADKVYGEMGKYATVINPFPVPTTAQESAGHAAEIRAGQAAVDEACRRRSLGHRD